MGLSTGAEVISFLSLSNASCCSGPQLKVAFFLIITAGFADCGTLSQLFTLDTSLEIGLTGKDPARGLSDKASGADVILSVKGGC